MSERCSYCISDQELLGYDRYTARTGEPLSQECLRPDGHAGPHLVQRIRRVGARIFLWEKAICGDCNCEALYTDDWDDVCTHWVEIGFVEAKRYLKDPEYIGPDWG